MKKRLTSAIAIVLALVMALPLYVFADADAGAAETYKLGDVDHDGAVTDWDSVLLERYLAGWELALFASAD